MNLKLRFKVIFILFSVTIMVGGLANTAMAGYVRAAAGAHGKISPSGVIPMNKTVRVFTITPDTGYQIASVVVNGKDLKPVPSTYTFYPRSYSETISVTFTRLVTTYQITATSGSQGGSISPSGTALVNSNDSKVYTIMPDAGYRILSVIVNGIILNSSPSTYTFSKIISNQTISATFAPNPYQFISDFYDDAVKHNYVINLNLLNLAVSKTSDLIRTDVNGWYQASMLLVNHLFSLTSKAINQYQSAPNSANLQIAINDVALLKPYNSTQINNLSYYDYSMNQLAQAVTTYLTANNKIQLSKATDSDFKTDNSFAYHVALDNSGNVYVSVPSYLGTGFGAIYEIQKNTSKIIKIAPIVPNKGDQFGRLFAISGDTLIASSEPVNGRAQLYIFSFKKNQWVQQNILDLTSVLNIKTIRSISLAFSGNTLVVGLTDYGKYVVFDKNAALSTSDNSVWQVDLIGSLTGNNAPLVPRLAVEGDFIVIGAPSNNGFVRILKRATGDPSHIFNWVAKDIYSNKPFFGNSVAISRGVPVDSTYTIAIGSPNENKGGGAVYTMTGSINQATNNVVWSDLQPLNLFVNSGEYAIGQIVAISKGMLMVSGGNTTTMVYKLNSSNQWTWAYTSMLPASWSSYFSYATDGTTVVIGQQHADYGNCVDNSGSNCIPSMLQVVQP